MVHVLRPGGSRVGVYDRRRGTGGGDVGGRVLCARVAGVESEEVGLAVPDMVIYFVLSPCHGRDCLGRDRGCAGEAAAMGRDGGVRREAGDPVGAFGVGVSLSE